jgi:creatinine amidohydrolase/Fe(II)-dependent formamide hydrolase-like protein
MIEPRSPHYLPRLTFEQVEARIRTNPSVVIPLAGLEPVGNAALGVAAVVCCEIADALSERTGSLLAPLYGYAHTTPFRSFGGAIGVKTKALATALTGVILDCAAQGIESVTVLDGGFDNSEALQLVRKRFSATHPRLALRWLAWQHDTGIRRFAAAESGVGDHSRCEFGLLSMAAHVSGELTRHFTPVSDGPGGNRERRWRKRGMDPEQLRKNMPAGTLCSAAPDAAFGAKLIAHIVDTFEKALLEPWAGGPSAKGSTPKT